MIDIEHLSDDELQKIADNTKKCAKNARPAPAGAKMCSSLTPSEISHPQR